jgi:mRNA-degrading endonuclease toxin of MazEF toxin-antitoxin module
MMSDIARRFMQLLCGMRSAERMIAHDFAGRDLHGRLQSEGPHPVIVVSRADLNRGRYVLAVVCTSTRFSARRTLPNCVPFPAGDFGFTKDCVAQCENILSIDQGQLDLDAGPIGVLDEIALRNVIKAIGHVIDADCEPI